MIPPEVAAAQRALKESLRFGDEIQSHAKEVLNHWQEIPCPYCIDGVKSENGVGRFVCQRCEGSAKVWVRR